MENRVAWLGVAAAAGALGAGVWWLRRSVQGSLVASEALLAPEEPLTFDNGARLRIPTRRERYLASLELDVLNDTPPPSGEWADSAVFDDDPFGLDDGPLSEGPLSAAVTSMDDGPLSEGPMTERRVTARPHVSPPPVQSADDYEAVDAESLGEFFLVRAIDSRD
jgi:hypothetical protein